jgi:hypothetical protein
MHRNNRRLRSLSLLVAIATATTISVAAAPAFAVTCVPNIVEYSAPESAANFSPLVVQCDGINYLGVYDGNPNVTTCGETSLDTLKAWLSMAQAALLAGKKLNINTVTCGTSQVIKTIDLLRS